MSFFIRRYGPWLLGVAVGTAFWGAAPSHCLANFINGSFEADSWSPHVEGLNGAGAITGWTPFRSTGNAFYLAGVNNSETWGDTPFGKQYLVLGPTDVGGNYVEQAVSGFTSGLTYTLEFWMASEFDGNANVRVLFPDGSGGPSADFSAPPRISNFWDNWVVKTHNFTATGGTVLFRFLDLGSSNGGFDVGLDNVSVNLGPAVVPEPSSLVLFGIGAAAAPWLFRRRRAG